MNQADFIEEEETTPPIPPDCPYFYTVEGKLKWEAGPSPVICFDCNEYDESFKYWRPIIAAVARCAWRDVIPCFTNPEYLKFVEIQKQHGCTPFIYENQQSYNVWDEFIEQTEEAWRIWGEEK
jgi:hypothetical protein